MSDYPRGPRNNNNQGSNFQGPFSSRPQGSRPSAPRSAGEGNPRQSGTGARPSSSRSERGTSSYQAMNGSRSSRNQESTGSRFTTRSSHGESSNYDSSSRPTSTYRDSESSSFRQASSAREWTRESEAYDTPSRSRSERTPLSRSSQVDSMSRSRSAAGRGGRGGSGNGGGTDNKFLQAIRWDVWGKYVTWKTVTATFGGLFLLGAIILIYLFATVPDIGIEKLKEAKSPSMVYSNASKEAIGRVGEKKQQFISLKELEKHNKMLIETLIKVEDARFREHDGVDFQGLGRAVYLNILNPGEGGGGGTLAMQIARNMILNSREKTANRKISEMKIAWDLIDNKDVGHDGVLENYLNYIDFGANNIQGVRMAAKIYFNKDIKEEALTPEEVATLIAIPNNPSRFNPQQEKRIPKVKERRDWILKKKMTDSEYSSALISMEEAEKAAAKPVEITDPEDNQFKAEFKNDKHAAYLDYVQKELKDRYGLTTTDLQQEGYKIYVGIDEKMDQIVEEEINNPANFDNEKNINATFAITDPKTGLVKAVAGGRGFKKGDLNFSTQKFQPGSSIKPIAVYAPYLNEDANRSIYSMVDSSDFKIPGWDPRNYSGKQSAKPQMTVDEGLYTSDNQVAARLLNDEVKAHKSREYLGEMGIKTDDHDGLSALSLGGLYNGVTPVDMTRAYATFLNNGQSVATHTIVKVLDREGKERKPESGKELPESKEVFTPQTAYWTTLMMKHVITDGSGKKNVKIKNHEVAGKTGTTQESKSGTFVGFTNDLVAASFVFNKDGVAKKDLVEITGGNQPSKLFSTIMTRVLADYPPSTIEKPDGVQEPPRPFNLSPFDFNISWNGQGININIIGGQGVNDPRVTYTVERMDQSGQYQKVAEGPAGSLTDASAPVDPNIPNQTFKYKVTASVQGNDSIMPLPPVEKELTLQGLQPQQPQQPCDPLFDPKCKPTDPNNPGGGGQDPGNQDPTGGNLKPRDCVDPANRDTPFCQQVAQDCALDPNKYPYVCSILNTKQ